MAMDDLVHQPEYKALAEAMQSEVAKIDQHYALRFLDYYRGLLKKHNTKRHKITLLCGMGICCVMIDGRHLHDYDYNYDTGIFKLLQQIEDSIDNDWGCYLDGQSLN